MSKDKETMGYKQYLWTINYYAMVTLTKLYVFNETLTKISQNKNSAKFG